MADGNAIIHLEGLGEPATKLIEKISDGVGGLFFPWQIKRVAKAEAQANLIRAQGEMEITDLQRRAMQRMLLEEEKKQQNMESITAKALPHLKEEARPQGMENDWIAHFFEKCRIVSDEEAQELWARVLAGEANEPGKFSKRTLALLSTLDQRDARLFNRICRFIWDYDYVFPIIMQPNLEIYRQEEVGFYVLSHLESIGLIHYDSSKGRQGVVGSFGIGLNRPDHVLHYFQESVIVDFPNENWEVVPIGYVLLTEVGKELASICSCQPVPGFFEYVLEKWHQLGFILSSPWPRPAA